VTMTAGTIDIFGSVGSLAPASFAPVFEIPLP